MTYALDALGLIVDNPVCPRYMLARGQVYFGVDFFADGRAGLTVCLSELIAKVFAEQLNEGERHKYKPIAAKSIKGYSLVELLLHSAGNGHNGYWVIDNEIAARWHPMP